MDRSLGLPVLAWPARRSIPVAARDMLAIGAVVVAFAALGIAHARLAPPFSKPDERYHFSYVVYLQQRVALPVVDFSRSGLGERPPDQPEAHQPPLYYLLVAALSPGRLPSAPVSFPNNPYFMTTPVGNIVPFVLATAPEAVSPVTFTFVAGRYLSLAFGSAALVFGYLALRTFLPTTVSAIGIALVAFNPQYLFIGTSFSNDVAGVAFVNLGLWLLLRGYQGGLSRAWALAFGFVLGLATLTKLGGLGLMVPFAAVVGFDAWRARTLRPLRLAILSILVFLGLTGWWFWRNYQLYDDLLGLSVLPVLLGKRPEPPDMHWLAELLRYLWKAYWVDFSPGTMGFADPLLYWAIAALMALGLTGSAIAVWKRRPVRFPLALLGGWLALTLAAVVRLTSQTAIIMGGGRLLFPASVTIGLVLSLGLGALAPRRFQSLLPVAAGLGFLVFSIVALDRYIVQRLPQAEMVRELPTLPRHSTRAAIGDAFRLVGFDSRRSDQADSVRVTYYWEAAKPARRNYTVFLQQIVHSPDGRDTVISQLDTYPGYGSSPTALWLPGFFVIDRLDLPIKRPPQRLGPDQSVLVITGLYDFQTLDRLRIGDRSEGARVLYDQAIIVADLDVDGR